MGGFIQKYRFLNKFQNAFAQRLIRNLDSLFIFEKNINDKKRLKSDPANKSRDDVIKKNHMTTH